MIFRVSFRLRVFFELKLTSRADWVCRLFTVEYFHLDRQWQKSCLSITRKPDTGGLFASQTRLRYKHLCMLSLRQCRATLWHRKHYWVSFRPFIMCHEENRTMLLILGSFYFACPINNVLPLWQSVHYRLRWPLGRFLSQKMLKSEVLFLSEKGIFVKIKWSLGRWWPRFWTQKIATNI